jgi:hypothetical protein
VVRVDQRRVPTGLGKGAAIGGHDRFPHAIALEAGEPESLAQRRHRHRQRAGVEPGQVTQSLLAGAIENLDPTHFRGQPGPPASRCHPARCRPPPRGPSYVVREVAAHLRPGGWALFGEPSWLHHLSPRARHDARARLAGARGSPAHASPRMPRCRVRGFRRFQGRNPTSGGAAISPGRWCAWWLRTKP